MRLYRFRSAVRGTFVTAAYALAHPRETVRELIRRRNNGKGAT